jgi:predicted Zn finger-like uncharacterized protein
MRHDCEKCHAAYDIPDDKVAGRFLKVRCKKCQNTMHVVGLRALDAAGADGAVWWCALGAGTAQQPLGPYREDEVLSLAADGTVHARTRMWCAGMNGWERVCESQTLAWVYNDVLEHASVDAAIGRTSVQDAFERAALLSDGKGYFPDPTLKSGIILLDDEMQRSIERLARTQSFRAMGAQGTRADVTSMLAPVMAAAIGAAAATGGVLWFVLSSIA